VTDPEVMKKLTATTMDWLAGVLQGDAPWAKRYAGILQVYRETGRDVVLRDAPHLIVATAPKAQPMGKDTGRYALAYVELYATALGLGSCWAGFFEGCASSGNAEIQKLLGIDDGTAVVGAIMVGYPRYTYKRLVDRNPLVAKWR
jgi:nitroreductase